MLNQTVALEYKGSYRKLYYGVDMVSINCYPSAMRVSARSVNRVLEKELFRTFYQLIADLKTPQEARTVFEDLLGKTESLTFAKRLGVIYWLSKGRTVANIRENLAVSSATIETIKHQMDKATGFKLAIKKVTADEWANTWSEKIRKVIR